MLTNIENRLEELFEQIEIMPPDRVEMAEKVILEFQYTQLKILQVIYFSQFTCMTTFVSNCTPKFWHTDKLFGVCILIRPTKSVHMIILGAVAKMIGPHTQNKTVMPCHIRLSCQEPWSTLKSDGDILKTTMGKSGGAKIGK